jgi:hypothetical protein
VAEGCDNNAEAPRQRLLHPTNRATEENDGVVTQRRRSPPKATPRETIRDVAAQLRDILEAVERGELVAEPGLVARLEGAALALEALGEVQPPGH